MEAGMGKLLLAVTIVGAQPAQLPEITRLELFAGTWNASVRALGPTGGSTSAEHGQATYHWDSGHRWLRYESRFSLAPLGPYEVHGVVGYDEQAKRYRAWAFNSLGVAIEYTGAWENKTTLAFTSTTNTARVVYTCRPDGSIRLLSERRQPDGSFEAYFESILSKSRSRNDHR